MKPSNNESLLAKLNRIFYNVKPEKLLKTPEEFRLEQIRKIAFWFNYEKFNKACKEQRELHEELNKLFGEK